MCKWHTRKYNIKQQTLSSSTDLCSQERCKQKNWTPSSYLKKFGSVALPSNLQWKVCHFCEARPAFGTRCIPYPVWTLQCFHWWSYGWQKHRQCQGVHGTWLKTRSLMFKPSKSFACKTWLKIHQCICHMSYVPGSFSKISWSFWCMIWLNWGLECSFVNSEHANNCFIPLTYPGWILVGHVWL